MHLDAHYYAVLAFAVECGFKEESAKTLAYASQFVDDAKINQLTISGDTYGIPLDCQSPPCLINMATCHSYCRLKTFNQDAMINNTCAFHFVPGCQGHNFAWKMTCAPEGRVLQQIKDAALKENNLVKFGIVLHAWADSYSHQGFSGLLSKTNDIDRLDAKSKVYLSEGFYLSSFILGLKKNIFSRNVDNILDRLVPPYGHAQALNFPDEPYIDEWTYAYDQKDIYYMGHKVEPRNNIDCYRKAFQSITNLLHQFLKNHPSHLNPKVPSPLSPPVHLYDALLKKKPRKKREKDWLGTLTRLKQFVQTDKKDLEYRDTLWLAEAFENYETESKLFKNRRIVNGAILKETFLQSNWYKYYLAVRWYKKLFHQCCNDAGLVFDHEPYFP
jgi:hypothetical protein